MIQDRQYPLSVKSFQILTIIFLIVLCVLSDRFYYWRFGDYLQALAFVSKSLSDNLIPKRKMRPSMVNSNTASVLMLLLVGIILFEVTTINAAPHPRYYPGYYSQLSLEGQNPEYLLQTIARLRQALINDDDLENSKRGLDLGLGRGFSGSQAAKHLMGLAAANFAGGPGRRRRSNDDDA